MMEHLFLACPVARALWDHSGLDYLGQGLPRDTFPLFLKKLMSRLNQPQLVMALAALLWRIWRSRNRVVFEGKQFGIAALMRQFHQQCQEWDSIHVDPVILPLHSLSNSLDVVQSAAIVCRWDGATKSGSHSAGDLVVLSQDGAVCLAKGVQFPMIDDHKVVELLALREAIHWCLDRGFSAVCFEDDAQVIIERIHHADTRDN
ncbi:unnamed protein product [Linum trigynum]|uniref:RNase H type-1 domain-containing protein n=1 Tax=Linum trigynum TaxID=586398 RepID=A0AAV2CWA7_9ROSI